MGSEGCRMSLAEVVDDFEPGDRCRVEYAQLRADLATAREALTVVQPILDELARAERKFPTYPTDVIHAAAIVGEESGELQQAALQATYEGGTLDACRKEAVHTGAMALRFLLHLPLMELRQSEQKPRSEAVLRGEALAPKDEGGTNG